MKFAVKVERTAPRSACSRYSRREFFEALSSSLDTLKDMKVDFKIVFMDATDETLIVVIKKAVVAIHWLQMG